MFSHYVLTLTFTGRHDVLSQGEALAVAVVSSHHLHCSTRDKWTRAVCECEATAVLSWNTHNRALGNGGALNRLHHALSFTLRVIVYGEHLCAYMGAYVQQKCVQTPATQQHCTAAKYKMHFAVTKFTSPDLMNVTLKLIWINFSPCNSRVYFCVYRQNSKCKCHRCPVSLWN